MISNQERSGAHIDNSGSSITFYLSVAHLDHEGACTQVTNAIESLFNVGPWHMGVMKRTSEVY